MMLSDINTRGVIFFSTDFISTFKRKVIILLKAFVDI
jgi:hypothetical protein